MGGLTVEMLDYMSGGWWMEGGVVYVMILLTTPAPTVRPPSRMAKRRPGDMAIGVMSLICRLVLSPGTTISTLSGRVMSPVTSAVRKKN
jgi:hypothetical protein